MKKLTALFLAFALFVLLLPASFAAQTEVKVAAFTFDDGPNKTITPALLDALAERGVRATFFVNGKNAEAYPEIVLRAAAEGHQIANHTYSHSYLTRLSAENAAYEISREQKFLSSLLGEDDYLVRVPYGAINDTVQSLINVPIIMWSVDPTSGKVMSGEAMRDGIVRTAHDGAIILLHDTSQANLQAAVESIDILMGQGYVFVTMNELFEIKGVEPKAHTVYHKLTGGNVAAFYDGSDISTHWAYEDISYVGQAGVMIGDSTGFRPEWGLTRAEAVMVLYRLAGEPAGYPDPGFTDVKPDAWYRDAVAWAKAEDVTEGVSETRFGPQQYVTKEQFYTLFARFIWEREAVPLPDPLPPEPYGTEEPSPEPPVVGDPPKEYFDTREPAPDPFEAEFLQPDEPQPLPPDEPEAGAENSAPSQFDIEFGAAGTDEGAPQLITPEPPAGEAYTMPGDEYTSAWAVSSINALRAAGFRSAAPGDRFAPRSVMRRAEVAELLAWHLRRLSAA